MENITSIAKSRSPGRLIAVANRLQVVFEKNPKTGDRSGTSGSGSLIGPLVPVRRDPGRQRPGPRRFRLLTVPALRAFVRAAGDLQAVADRDPDEFPNIPGHLPVVPPEPRVLPS